MKDFLCPGNPPYAASALIIHPSGLVLSVSRKHDPKDLGLPGGKVDPGQNFTDACIAEVAQETGLEVIQLEPFFGDYCGTPGIHKVHWTLTFVCKVKGHIHTEEPGKVCWVNHNRLICHPKDNFRLNSFSDYNRAMLAQFFSSPKVRTPSWHSDIELDERFVDRDW